MSPNVTTLSASNSRCGFGYRNRSASEIRQKSVSACPVKKNRKLYCFYMVCKILNFYFIKFSSSPTSKTSSCYIFPNVL